MGSTFESRQLEIIYLIPMIDGRPRFLPEQQQWGSVSNTAVRRDGPQHNPNALLGSREDTEESCDAAPCTKTNEQFQV